MIQMQLTDAGLAAITRNENIVFTKFVTGSGTEGTDHIVVARQDVPISYSQTYIKGQSYLINGVQTTVNYNAVEMIGTLSSGQASESYTWTELALMAREGAGQEYTFAYGISVNNAYHVNPSEPVTFVIPFSVIFTATPNVTVQTTETGVSWSAFLEHANLNVITGAHGLEVKNGRIFVNNVELDIATQTALTTDVNTLRAEMQLADGDLADSISSLGDTVDSEVDTLQGNIDTVAGNLTSSVSTINSRITSEVSTLNDTITSEANTLDTKIDTEVDTLQGNIDTLSDSLTSNVNTLDARITSEANTLDTKIDTQVSTLDTKIDTEAGTLDAKIDSEVDTLEGTISDNYTTLTGLIDTTSTALQNSIDTKTANLLLDLNTRTVNIIGIDMITDTLPLDVMEYVGKLAYRTTDNKLYLCQYKELIEVGDFIKAIDGVWQKVSADTEEALLVVADDAELASMEIHWTEAQSHFTGWLEEDTVETRLRRLETRTTPFLTYQEHDTLTYNDEWEDRMTGEGTPASPYLIYTPKDFESIRSRGNNNGIHYRIENNLDFSKVIGIEVDMSSGTPAYVTVDENAPLYNEGQGFIPFVTAQYNMELDGNGHIIKNLIISDNSNNNNCGLFRYIERSVVKNIIFKDCYITYYRTHYIQLGTLSGESRYNCQFINICSYAYLYPNNVDYESRVGGIIGKVQDNCRFENCAFHGKVFNQQPQTDIVSGIVGFDDSQDDNQFEKSKFYNCYNTSDLYGYSAQGICWRGLILYNCYNTGRMTATDLYYSNRSNSLTSFVNSYSIIDNCYSLKDCARTIQGTILTDTQFKSGTAVDLLNDSLTDPVYVKTENGYPALDFELLAESSLSITTPIACVNPQTKQVIDSGYTLGDLIHTPTNKTIVDLRTEIQTKSSVRNLNITLEAANWSDSSQTILNENVLETSVLVMVPKSADTFTNGISITAQAEGSITFGYTTAPSDSINVDVLVIN